MTDRPPRDCTPRPRLLDELEAIRTLLETDTPGHSAPAATTIPHSPAPSTPTPPASPAATPLLDLDFIFSDGDITSIPVPIDADTAPLLPHFTLAVPDQPVPDYHRPCAGAPVPEARIEDLMRYLMPRIEHSLREHLAQLDTQSLEHWHQRLS